MGSGLAKDPHPHTHMQMHTNTHLLPPPPLPQVRTWHSLLFSLWVPKQLVMLIAGPIDGECRLNRASQCWRTGWDPRMGGQ